MTTPTEILFELKYSDGTWYINGITIVGCWLWGPDLEQIAKDLPYTANYLIDANGLNLPKIGEIAPGHE